MFNLYSSICYQLRARASTKYTTLLAIYHTDLAQKVHQIFGKTVTQRYTEPQALSNHIRNLEIQVVFKYL